MLQRQDNNLPLQVNITSSKRCLHECLQYLFESKAKKFQLPQLTNRSALTESNLFIKILMHSGFVVKSTKLH